MDDCSTPKCKTTVAGFRRGSAGFTLIELMVVITIFAILMGVATPTLMDYLRQRGAREAADQLAMDLQRAKLLAVSRNTNSSIIFDAPNNRYTISLTNQIVDLGNYRGGVTFTGLLPDPPRFTFNSQGLCSDSGEIFLTNADGTATFRLRTTIAGGISQN